MQFKLQLTNNSGDDPTYWNNYRTTILYNFGVTQSFDEACQIINNGLIEYHAVYVIEDTSAYRWNDYVLFATEADHFLFMLAWG